MIRIQWFIFALLGALFTGLALVVEKKTLKSEHALKTVASLSIFHFLLLLLIVNRINFNLELSIFVLLYLISIVGTFGSWYAAKGLRHLEISTAIPLLSFGPALVAIFSWIFLGETLNGIKISGILLIMLGSYVIEIDHKISDLKEPLIKIIKSRYIHYIFIALFFLSVAVTLDRYVLSSPKLNIDFLTYLFFIQIFSTVNYLILVKIFHRKISVLKNTIKFNWKWLLLTSVFGIFGMVFFFKAIILERVSLVYPIHKLNSLFSTLIGGELFHEHKLVLKTIATLIMLIGGYLIVF